MLDQRITISEIKTIYPVWNGSEYNILINGYIFDTYLYGDLVECRTLEQSKEYCYHIIDALDALEYKIKINL